MNHQEFMQRLSRKDVPSVLFFEGPEEHLKQEALSALRRELLPEGMEDLNETRFTAPETDEVIAAAETLPFLADRRLIILRDFPAALGRQDADPRLVDYLSQVPPTAVMVFYCVYQEKPRKSGKNSRKADSDADPEDSEDSEAGEDSSRRRRGSIRSAVEKLGGLVQFQPLRGEELTSFVTKAFRDQGRECDDRTADFLIFTCGTDINRLLTEVAKIASYHPEVPAVSPDDIRALASPSAESRVFALVDAVVAGRNAEAFRRLNDLLRIGEERIMIQSLLLRQFRLLQHIKIMKYERRSTAEIAAAIGQKPNSYIARQMIDQASGFSGGQVKQALALCLETDLGVKSGLLPQLGALETLMLKLLQLKNVDPGNGSV